MRVKNMTNNRGNKAPNQFILTDDFSVTFQSYDSKIATYNRTTSILTVFPHWDYSKTTLKFFKQFVNDYTRFEYVTKAQFEKLMKSYADIVEMED